VRLACFIRDGWRCVECGFEPDIVRMAREAGVAMPPANRVLEELRLRFGDGRKHLHADHQIPIEQAPELRLDLRNLRTRCNVCNVSRRNRGNPNVTSNVPERDPEPVEISPDEAR
jgi:5-methylcytosine-specific restriction endonuclease McrA